MKWPRVYYNNSYPRGPYTSEMTKGEYKCQFCKYRHSDNLICGGVQEFLNFLRKENDWPNIFKENE